MLVRQMIVRFSSIGPQDLLIVRRSASRASFPWAGYLLLVLRASKKSDSARARAPPRSPVTNWLRESIKQLFSLVTATPRYEPIGRSRKPGCMFGKSGSVLLGSGARYFCVVFIRARNPGPDSCLVPQISDSGMWAGQLGVGACLQPRSPYYFDSFGIDQRKNYTGDPILK